VPKTTPLTDELYAYLIEHRSADDELLTALRAETRELMGPRARMQVAADQGTLLGVLVGMMEARRVVEVGTFTGYSALCMARSLPPDGRLLACDVSEEYAEVARRYWERAGLADKIELRIGPAIDTLRALPEDPWIDFAFIDADKESYRAYYEELLKRLRPNGVVALDNVLWGGSVVLADDTEPSTLALRDVSDHIAGDPRVQSVMLHVSDGLTLARKLP
jgi:caffeoyl-CoA O-methyltransferase